MTNFAFKKTQTIQPLPVGIPDESTEVKIKIT